MKKSKAAFIIDKIEFQYFEFNKLVTSFWLIEELNRRGWEVYISTADKLSLKNNKAYASLFKTTLVGTNGKSDLERNKNSVSIDLEEMDLVFFRPDPPIDINYIHCTYLLDFIDRSKTLVINDPTGIRKANEKIYINNFSEYVPANVTTRDISLLKDFLNEHGEVIIKPLNKCFGKGVFYLKKGDKNTNSILETATDFGTTNVMAQEFLNNNEGGDKRVNIICGDLIEEVVLKKSGEGDFKFNSHKDESFAKAYLTEREREICHQIAPKLMEDGLYLVGLDFLDERIIEINVTSPCFFIKEINALFNTELEKKIVNKIECLMNQKLLSSV